MFKSVSVEAGRAIGRMGAKEETGWTGCLVSESLFFRLTAGANELHNILGNGSAGLADGHRSLMTSLGSDSAPAASTSGRHPVARASSPPDVISLDWISPFDLSSVSSFVFFFESDMKDTRVFLLLFQSQEKQHFFVFISVHNQLSCLTAVASLHLNLIPCQLLIVWVVKSTNILNGKHAKSFSKAYNFLSNYVMGKIQLINPHISLF